MENGIVRINNGIGRIDTVRDPSPVTFAPQSFPKIVNGEDVFFQRAVSQPDWAVTVVPAEAVNSLISAGTPSGGLTPSAQTLLIKKAVLFVEEAQAAPSSELERAHLKFGHTAMKSLSKTARLDTGRVGVRAVLAALK